MQKILLGPAGSPANSTLEGVSVVKKIGLHAMEVAFTHGIKMSPSLAEQVGEVAQKEKVKLSIHAPYYINLLSTKKETVVSSRKRIIDSLYRGHKMNATKVVFHPGYYGSNTKKEAYTKIKKELEIIQKEIKKRKWKIDMAPETMGRTFQFGHFDDTLKLAKEVKCNFCVDVSHIYALNQGKIDYDYIFDKISKLRKDVHFHFQGIEFNEKGEKRHLVLNGNPSFKEFAKKLLFTDINATIICESPVTWEDSLRMKKILEGFGHRFDKGKQ